ncbi:MAG: RpoL/Rpb11 RNA polymerase subunit family protein [Nanoarchaeota archaeon]
MNVKILEEKGKHLKLSLQQVDKGFLIALQKELNADENITEVGVNFGHPLLHRYDLIVNSNGKVMPKDAVMKALDRIGKVADKFNTAFQDMK